MNLSCKYGVMAGHVYFTQSELQIYGRSTEDLHPVYVYGSPMVHTSIDMSTSTVVIDLGSGEGLQ